MDVLQLVLDPGMPVIAFALMVYIRVVRGCCFQRLVDAPSARVAKPTPLPRARVLRR